MSQLRGLLQAIRYLLPVVKQEGLTVQSISEQSSASQPAMRWRFISSTPNGTPDIPLGAEQAHFKVHLTPSISA
jgi:hypothetical protein